MESDPLTARVHLDRPRLEAFCRRHFIRKLSFFGSVLRDDFAPKSDVDVLVEFEEGHVPGLEFFAMERELARLLGRTVDLQTPNFLNRYIRDQILSEARTLYVAA